MVDTVFALWRYGADDPDNDIECLGRYTVNDGDTLALSCEGTYDGVSVTVSDGKIVLDYINGRGQAVKEEILKE